MAAYVLRKLSLFGLTLLLASALIFVALRFLGGNPAAIALGSDATPADLRALEAQMGLNRPLWNQYVDWLGDLVTGSLGVSAVSKVPVGPQLSAGLGVTLSVAIVAIVLALVVAVPLGFLASIRSTRSTGAVISGTAHVGLAIPSFWLGLVLSLVFAVTLRMFPSGGYARLAEGVGPWLQSITLPVVALAAGQAAIFVRYTRASLLDIANEDFIRTARMKGLNFTQSMTRHGLRNAMLPVLTVVGIQFGFLIGGTLVIENVFFLPGLGRIMMNALGVRDLVLVQSGAMVITFIILLANLLVDLLYGVIDPRVKARRV
jgi:peptide/nickel transport system permease protein